MTSFTKSLAEVNNSVGSDRNKVASRLSSIDVSDPFVALDAGSKASTVDHTDPENQFSIQAVGESYGVMAVGRLGFVDIDTDDPPEKVVELTRSNPTLTVKSPHEGRHFYYEISGDAPNARKEWGELRVSNQYVVGPGSTIDHARCGGCGFDGEGAYSIIHDRPIATIDASDLDAVTDRTTETTEAIETDLNADHGAHHRIQRRVEKAKGSKHGKRFTQLWEGRYRAVGHITEEGDTDRSTAEAELVMRLGFWFEKSKEDVAAAMDLACGETPMTADGLPRKWLVRPGVYRSKTLELVDQVDRSYQGSDSEPGFRPTVSRLTSKYVLDAVMDLGLASTAEIEAHPKVDRSERQVERALKTYQEVGAVNRVRDGRRILYYAFDGPCLSDEQRDLVALLSD